MMTYQEFKEKFSLVLNPAQESATKSADGAILLLAVPGSGKTTVLVARLGYLLYVHGVVPENILTMTYTVSATKDMRERFSRIFGEEYADRLEFRTINGVCARIILLYERMYGRKAFDLLSDERQIGMLLSNIYRDISGTFVNEGDLKTIRQTITYVKNSMLTAEEIRAMKMDELHFPKVYEKYNEVLRQQNLMDYDDQMTYAYRILQKYPAVLAKMQSHYRYICVDEAQDTSKIQHKIIALLAKKSGNIFMVGDEDQSIYGFRAAYPEALMNFENTYPNATVLLMEENYRSTPQIVEKANIFVSKNCFRREKQIRPTRKNGKDVRQIPVFNRRAEHAYLSKIARECTMETAFLYRDNESALPLIDLFLREKIPYRMRSFDDNFFTHRVIKDITDIFHFAENPYDTSLFMNLYYKLDTGRLNKISANEVCRLSQAEGMTVLEAACELADISAYAKKQCQKLINHLEMLRNERADRAIFRIMHPMGYEKYLEDRKMDISKMEILEIIGAREATPKHLLRRLDMLREVVKNGASADSFLTLSTVHSAKGLEFRRVFLMDIADGIFPKTPPPDKNADAEEIRAYEEERRLFYVAMTRAKDELSVFQMECHPTPSFLKEIFPTKTLATSVSSPAKPRSVSRFTDADFPVGIFVRHARYGMCRIAEKRGDILIMTMPNGDEKQFSLAVLLENALLEPITPT